MATKSLTGATRECLCFDALCALLKPLNVLREYGLCPVKEGTQACRALICGTHVDPIYRNSSSCWSSVLWIRLCDCYRQEVSKKVLELFPPLKKLYLTMKLSDRRHNRHSETQSLFPFPVEWHNSDPTNIDGRAN